MVSGMTHPHLRSGTTALETRKMAACEKEFGRLALLPTLILIVSSSIVQALVTEGASTKASAVPSTTSAAVQTADTSELETFTHISDLNATVIHNNQKQTSPLSEENSDADTGRIAGIIIGVLGGLAIITTVVAFLVYKQYLRRNVTSMNFDNPVYRKTTEDQFSLEKNQYQPARSYPPGLEPLTSPGTNEFV